MAPALALDIPSARKSRSARLGQLQVPPDNFSSQPTAGTESEEFDFSDVFGPIPPPHAVHQLASVDEGVELADWGPPELHFDSETLVICSRSHSLVGPSPRPSLSRQLSKFSFDEDNSFKGKRQAAAFSLDPKENIAPDAEINSNISNSPLEVDASVSSVNSRDAEKPKEKLGPQDFELKRVVGQGAFGKVFQVQKKGTAEIYAMKVMRKDKIVERNHAGYMKAERDILTKMVHPFIVQLQYSFQTKTKLYLILDFINGGHLFFQLYRQGMFSEDLARLYSAEIVCAVAHLHSNDIIHRDLKPENILLDAEGHVRLTDFGLAKEISDSCPSNSLCGTMEYMAPEIILAKGHGKAADWWSVGILLYEMVTGQPPFSHSNRKKLQDKIIQDKIKLPSYLTSDAHSLLKGLLQKDPSKRLGSGVNGSDDIRRHKWFKSINWKKLEAREIQPKFTPEVHGTMCIANFDEKWTTMPPQDSPASTPRAGDHSAFTGFSYIAPNLWLPCLDKSPSKAPF